MATRQQQIAAARSLPKRLQDFFRKHPPPALTQRLSTRTSSLQSGVVALPTMASNTSSANPNAPILESSATEEPIPSAAPTESTYRNPFQPTKNFRNGRWHSPIYGLRQQAELVKLAEKYNVVDLLPYTIKKPGEKAKRREEQGLRVRGTGVGQVVKGHKWERTLQERLKTRRQAMMDMPRLIQEWKQKGHGRGWKKWPK